MRTTSPTRSAGWRPRLTRGTLLPGGVDAQAADVGEINELDVWHDNSGSSPGWHLDFIEVGSV